MILIMILMFLKFHIVSTNMFSVKGGYIVAMVILLKFKLTCRLSDILFVDKRVALHEI